MHTIDPGGNTLGGVLETKGQGQGDLYDFIFTDYVRGQYSHNNKTSFPQPPHPITTSVS